MEIKRTVYEIVWSKDLIPSIVPIIGKLSTKYALLGEVPLTLYFIEGREGFLYRDQLLFSDVPVIPDTHLELKRARTEFRKEMSEIIENLHTPEIYVNCYIASALQDLRDFKLGEKIPGLANNNPYPVGTFLGATIYVDPNMKYFDHRVLDKVGNVYHDFETKYSQSVLI